jgi:chemotaxis protein methyltransferase CheR
MEDSKNSESGLQGVVPSLSLSDEAFSLFADLIYETSGIKLNVMKKGLLTSRLLKRLRKLDCKDFYDYYQRVKDNRDELIEMLNCISTHTTKFFRENYHFEYLKTRVIPEFIKDRPAGTIRIWSAGCSTGEEPYSIAITVNEALRTIHAESKGIIDIKILATDISTNVLETAEAGIYEYEQLPDEMPPDMAGRYFLRGVKEYEGKIRVKNFIRDMIRFRRLNLKDGIYPFQRKFDIIFCRNVMIYFDEDMKRHVLSMFYRHLSDNGYLFLGHSETMLGSNGFKPVFITTYKKQ